MYTPRTAHGRTLTVPSTNPVGIIKTVEDCPDQCCQIMGGQLYLSPGQKKYLAAVCADKSFQIFVHSPLYLNLAGEKRDTHREVLERDLQFAADLPCSVILHIGRHGDDVQGAIERLAEQINIMSTAGFFRTVAGNFVDQSAGSDLACARKLLLEVSAGTRGQLGSTWDELRKIFEALDTSSVGLCLDTQHLFAAGMSKLETSEDIVRLFDNCGYIGASVELIHLNDSKVSFGAHVDRHAPLRQGYIWTADDIGLRSLISNCRSLGIPTVSETSDQDADMAIVRGII